MHLRSTCENGNRAFNPGMSRKRLGNILKMILIVKHSHYSISCLKSFFTGIFSHGLKKEGKIVSLTFHFSALHLCFALFVCF